jgi:hypothetical protein
MFDERIVAECHDTLHVSFKFSDFTVLSVQIVVLGYGSMLPCRWMLVFFWNIGIYLHDSIVLQPERCRILQRQQLKLFLHY